MNATCGFGRVNCTRRASKSPVNPYMAAIFCGRVK